MNILTSPLLVDKSISLSRSSPIIEHTALEYGYASCAFRFKEVLGLLALLVQCQLLTPSQRANTDALKAKLQILMPSIWKNTLPHLITVHCNVAMKLEMRALNTFEEGMVGGGVAWAEWCRSCRCECGGSLLKVARIISYNPRNNPSHPFMSPALPCCFFFLMIFLFSSFFLKPWWLRAPWSHLVPIPGQLQARGIRSVS